MDQHTDSLKEKSFRTAVKLVLTTFGLVVLACCSVVFIVWAGLGQSPLIVLHDPSVQFGFPLYAGAVSTVGIWFLVAAGAVCTFGALFPLRQRLLLGVAACMCFTMALDDAFLLHEGILRDRLGLSELLLPALYATLAMWICAQLASLPRRFVLIVFVTGIALLAGSVGLDVSGMSGMARSLAEDLLKLTGFAAIGSSLILLVYTVIAEALWRRQ